MSVSIGISLNMATANQPTVATFARVGADCVRFIAKGYAPEQYIRITEELEQAGTAVRSDFKLMIDLPGERPRLGHSFEEFPVFRGMTILIIDQTDDLEESLRPLTVPAVHFWKLRESVAPGHRLLISDGATELQVLEVLPSGVLAEATRDALISPNRSIMLPDSDYRYGRLAQQDLDLITLLASKSGETTISVSMVEDASQINDVKASLPTAFVIAKIETQRGIRNAEAIAKVADGLMLARGDLSLSIGVELVPAAAEYVLAMAESTCGLDNVILATGLVDGVQLQGRVTIADVTDLWYFYKLGIRRFLLSGGVPEKHGRSSIEVLRATLEHFRFPAEELRLKHWSATG